MSVCSRPDKDKAGAFQPAHSIVQQWPEETLADKLKLCDGGTGLLERCKQANNGVDVKIEVGSTRQHSLGGLADLKKGSVFIRNGDPECIQIETLVFELGRFARRRDIQAIDAEAAGGDLDREEYIRQNAAIEFDCLQDVITAVDKCSDKWDCARHVFDCDVFRSAKDFDDYFDNYLSPVDKERFGAVWDGSFQKYYLSKHPE